MHVIQARNPHEALPELMYQLRERGVRRESRNGPVIRLPGPTTIEFKRPTERVVFWPLRDANPFFHLLESLWMLGGRNDVEFPASIVSTMADFSDDGKTFNAAYGYRWRRWFQDWSGYAQNSVASLPAPCERDQLITIADALRQNPDCRRQVLSMWDGHHDLGLASKDIPCNTHAYFSIEEGALNMTVCNRSNDAVWGALGANVVHFSILQEYLAAMIGNGVAVGRYWQVSNNMHLYLDRHKDLMERLAAEAWPRDVTSLPYYDEIHSVPLLAPGETIEDLDKDIDDLLRRDGSTVPRTRFIEKVAFPMLFAIDEYRSRDVVTKYTSARSRLLMMPENCDWRRAATEWIDRRAE